MLRRLICRSFRNLEALDWRPEPGGHLLLGANGAGKTSLLEAVYLLATTRSFRTSQVADCRRHGSDGFHLEGEVESDRRTALEVGWREGGRYRRLNGSVPPLADHLETLPVVAWTAAQGEWLTGPPAVRRRFLDQGIVGERPVALVVLGRYRRALAQKRRLLADGARGLGPWNQVLASAGHELGTLRARYAERLGAALAALIGEVAPELPPVSLRYRPSLDPAQGEAALLERLAGARERARRLGRPLVGPHLDELEIRWGPRQVRRVASAGECKLLGLLLAAARGRLLAAGERAPVYLLDDLDTELDRDRLERVWRVFAGGRQVFVTSNRPEVWELPRAPRRWRLEDGALGPGGGPPGGSPGDSGAAS